VITLTKIFISHATADADLAIKLMDLLQNQFSLTRDNFFLTSDEELQVGGNWIEEIRRGMIDASIVMPIITPSFMESQFCLCELGAAWINDQALVPVIIPPLKHSALAATPYRAWAQTIIINDSDDLFRLAEAMIAKGVGAIQSVRFKTRAVSFCNDVLTPFVQEMKTRSIITAAAFKELQEDNASIMEAYNQTEQEIQLLKAENEALREMKDAEAVKALDYAQMDEWETFMSAVEDCKKHLEPLSTLTISILYHHRNNSGYGFRSQNDRSELNKLENQGFIKLDEGWEPVHEHPAIRRADQALDKLKSFIRESGDIIEERFEEEFKDVRFGLNFSPFWEEVLGENIQDSD
jgi:phage terminase small subunit